MVDPVTRWRARKGKTRVVIVHAKPGAKVARFARSTEPGKTGIPGALRFLGISRVALALTPVLT
jgi:hypothetical protein